MKNNDILKKLRIALKLTDQDILEILKLVKFEIGKGALNDFFRKEDHPKFVEAGDQVVRNFLNGLIIYKRGPMEERKPNKQSGHSDSEKPKRTYGQKKPFSRKPEEKKFSRDGRSKNWKKRD
ncbi:MAG: DUF1456 family protein [Bacteroidales bacterium]